MKKSIIYICAVVLLAACKQKGNSSAGQTAVTGGKTVAAADAPKIKFEQPIYDFGVIKEGEKVQNSFKFKNEGKTPLIITNATATCGCTVPEYPTTPIKPGESGEIKVIFDSTGKDGMQDKQVTVTSNANPEAEKLHLVGEVKQL
ncbi:MAG: DUF1573 domain-containing protein [Pedobacter sp.]|nr:DUF1573 domain-containing protein [Pedobacter sp.]MDQ8053728.1 DUF1573 domain-containing protein [Pedobacter sp.]